MGDDNIVEYQEPERVAVTKKNVSELLDGDNYFYYMRYPYKQYGDDGPAWEEIVQLGTDPDGKLIYLFSPDGVRYIKGLHPNGIWTRVKTRGFWNPTYYISEKGTDYDLFASKKTVCGQCGSSPGAVCGYCRY